MASNNFDGNVLIDDTVGTSASPNGYIGFQRAQGASDSTGPRIYAVTTSPNGSLTAPAGSIALQTNGTLWQNTNGATAWTQSGTLSGAVTLTAIDSTATASFTWSIADNSATSVRWSATGATGILGIDSTNGAERAFTNFGFQLNDTAALRFGTPGTDLVITADGTAAVVSGTGYLNFVDDLAASFGTDLDFGLRYSSGSNAFIMVGISSTAVAASPATAAASLTTGARTGTNAAVSSGSGAVAIASGVTDTTNAGGTGGASGALSLTSGAATSTLGTSGSSGSVSLVTGNSDDANSGNIVLTTGTAGGTRGVLDINAGTVDLTTQATAYTIIDNSATSYVLRESTNNYIAVSTLNSNEAIVFGNPTTNPSFTFGGIGAVQTDGPDMANRILLQERFNLKPALVGSTAYTNNESFKVAGTNAVDASITFGAGGGITLTTAGANNDQCVVLPQTAYAVQWDDLTWSSADSVTYKINVRVVDVANVKFFVGVKPTPTTLTDSGDTDQFVLRFDSSDGVTSAVNWVCVTSNANVDVLTDTGVAVTTATNYRIVLSVAQTSRQVSAFINGILVNVPASNALQAATNEGKPFIGIQALTGAAKAITTYAVACSKVQN